jgi:hypothetical protein
MYFYKQLLAIAELGCLTGFSKNRKNPKPKVKEKKKSFMQV